MSAEESVRKTLTAALALCAACSVVVSTAAVLLGPLQERNRSEDRKRNILAAAGMHDPSRPVAEQFAQIAARVVHLPSGRFADDGRVGAGVGGGTGAGAGAWDSAGNNAEDGGRFRGPDYAEVYLVGDPRQPDAVILPIAGAGLWGPMKGFIALREDFNTVAGIGFHEHKETPGLGGEVDNPRWKALWPGKLVYVNDGANDSAVALTVLKGIADRDGAAYRHEIDGLSGATLTTRGIDNMLKFWLGAEGFGPFLAELRKP